jgi:hypothetical protein
MDERGRYQGAHGEQICGRMPRAMGLALADRARHLCPARLSLSAVDEAIRRRLLLVPFNGSSRIWRTKAMNKTERNMDAVSKR